MEKTVLITGASRGIGAALAKTFAAEGYNLSLCCHNNTRLLNDHALSLHEQYGIQTLCFTGDVGDYSFAAHMVGETLDKFGHINVLINYTFIYRHLFFSLVFLYFRLTSKRR